MQSELENALNQIPEIKKIFFCDIESICEHIFTTNTVGGYHSEYLHLEQKNINIEKMFSNKVYCGRYNGKYSTFFPKSWNIERVIDEIISAYQNKYKPLYQIYGFPKIGKSVSGIYIAIETYDGKIKNAYPAFKQENKYYIKINV